MKLRSNSRSEAEDNTACILWKSYPWYVDINTETNKLLIKDIKLLMKVKLDLNLLYFNQIDINALATQLEPTNIEEPIDNLKAIKTKLSFFHNTKGS